MKKIPLIYIILILAMATYLLILPILLNGQESIYPLPPENSKTSISSPPEKVENSLKNVIAITSNIQLKQNSIRFMNNTSRAGGTGFIIAPGIFVSARHILMMNIYGTLGPRPIFSLNKYQVPSSDYFEYIIFGTSNAGNKSVDFPLTLLGMGDHSGFKDFMILKSSSHPIELKTLEIDIRILKPDETVYSAGYVPSFISNDARPDLPPILFDVIKKSFPGTVDAVIDNFQIPGIETIY